MSTCGRRYLCIGLLGARSRQAEGRPHHELLLAPAEVLGSFTNGLLPTVPSGETLAAGRRWKSCWPWSGFSNLKGEGAGRSLCMLFAGLAGCFVFFFQWF